MGRSKEKLLQELKQRRKHWTLSDAEKLLTAYGWQKRKATKHSAVWTRGTEEPLTLPRPHKKHLLPPYVQLILRKVE